MALVVNKSLLSDKQRKKIAEDLVIPSKKSDDDAELCLFHINDNDDVYIPFSYALSLLSESQLEDCAFFTEEYQSIYKTHSVEFIAELRSYQKQVYKEAINILRKNLNVFFSLYCGFGKTVLAIKASCDLGYKTIIITYSTTLYDQWVSEYKIFTKGKVVGLRNETEIPEADFYVCMVTLAEKLPLSFIRTIGTLIIDEATGFCTPIRSKIIIRYTPIYRIGLSATPSREDGFQQILPMIFGDKWITKISEKPFKVYKINTEFKPEVEIVKFGKYRGRPNWGKVIDSMSIHEQRNDFICKLAIAKLEKKIVILCKRLEQIDYLHSKLLKAGESVQKVRSGINSYKNCRILIGTFTKISVGFDEKGVCIDFDGKRINLVILATDIATTEGLEQSVGRGFRSDDPEIYDIVDDYSTFKKHFKEERLPWYLSRNAEVVEINANLEDLNL